MKKTFQNTKSMLIRLTASLCVGLLTFILCKTNALFSLDSVITDKMYQYGNSTNLGIYIVGIDEATLREYGSFVDWDRSVYADLVEALCKNGNKPAVITFDMLFTGNKTPEGDERFARACAECGNVIVGSCLEYDKIGVTDKSNRLLDASPRVNSITYPYPELNDAVESAFVNTSADFDGVMRYCFLTQKYNGTEVKSLALATYNKYMQYHNLTAGDFSSFEDKRTYFTYSFATKNNDIKYISMCDIIDGKRDYSDELDGKIVMVGAYAEGFQDDFPTAVNKEHNIYGVAIHADIIQALYSNAVQHRTDGLKNLVSVIFGVVSAAAMFILIKCPLPVGGAVSAGIIAVLTIADIILYRKGYYLPYIYLALTVLLAYIAMIFLHYISVRVEKNKLNNAFKLYVSPQVVDEVSKTGNYELKLGGQTKDIACLFIDIRGFTTMSEGLDPETVVGILNEYFAVITDAIFKNEGTLDKFIGDAAMAVYNSPFDLDDYEMRAIRSAIDIAKNSEVLRNKLLERYGRTINFGIGINCGPATIGNIGCDFRMDFTAIGDTVNTASRLESNAKAGQILISEEMYERVKDRVEAEDVGELSLKGKAKAIHTYNVLAIK